MNDLDEILKSFPYCITNELLKVNIFLKKNLSSQRYDHSLLTVQNGIDLALSNGLDKKQLKKLVIACLSHDITKEMPEKFHRKILKQNKFPQIDTMPKALFHSFSAPFFLSEKFKITGKEILHAVKYHSTGCSRMPVLSRIVFAADFLSSRIDQKNGLLKKESLRNICLEKLTSTIRFIVNKKIPVQTDSINFYNTLIREIHNEEDEGKTGKFQ